MSAELTEEELPERPTPDLLAELELAPDDMIHLAPRRIEKPPRCAPPPLYTDEIRTRRCGRGRDTESGIPGGRGSAGGRAGGRDQIQSAQRGIRAAPTSKIERERIPRRTNLNREPSSKINKHSGGARSLADPEKQIQKKGLVSPSEMKFLGPLAANSPGKGRGGREGGSGG